ncbi:MAG: hypothetical protein DRP09_17265, partial [Candidatus Thorarchaeota archaeon]
EKFVVNGHSIGYSPDIYKWASLGKAISILIGIPHFIRVKGVDDILAFVCLVLNTIVDMASKGD